MRNATGVDLLKKRRVNINSAIHRIDEASCGVARCEAVHELIDLILHVGGCHIPDLVIDRDHVRLVDPVLRGISSEGSKGDADGRSESCLMVRTTTVWIITFSE
jgi:hypothetical protein